MLEVVANAKFARLKLVKCPKYRALHNYQRLESIPATSEEKEKTMALTRKFLAALGIETDKIDEIISAHSETVDALKAERDKFKESAEKLPEVQKELEQVKAENEKNSPYKEKYDKEHADFEAYKKEQTDKETTAKKQEAYKELLKDAGVAEKHIDFALRHTNADDLAKLEFGDDGKVKDTKAITESIKKDWSDFIVEKDSKGAETATPPATGTKGGESSGEARAIYDELQKSHFGIEPSNNGNNNNGGKE